MKRWLSLPVRILLGFVAGVALGVVARSAWPDHIEWSVTSIAKPLGEVFLRLVFMTVMPLIFCSLALGVAGLKDLVTLGRVGLKTLAFTLVISSIAVLVGVGLVNVVRPGEGLSPEAQAKLVARKGGEAHIENATKAKTKGIGDALVEIIPKNVVADAAAGNFMSVMFFAFIFGLALAMIEPSRAEPVVKVMEGTFDALLKIIGLAMLLAPIGVAALVYSTVSTLGAEILGLLAKFVAVAVVGLAFHQFVVYSVILKYFAGVSPRWFFRQTREAMLLAFATSSSNATLPTSLVVTHTMLGVPKDITNFVLTLGSTANQNGTALFEGVTILFLAQLYGVDLTMAQQLQVVAMSILAGVGTAGVPGGSLPVIVLVMQSVGIPAEGIGVILGVDRFLDMCRTTLNVTGDIVVATYVARSEGHVLVARM